MDNLAIVDLSPVENKLAQVAFDLFRFWISKTKITDIVIKDERLLVDDLRTTLCDALQSLRQEDRGDKPMGWDVGFVLGFVNGHLGSKWHHTYIVRSGKCIKLMLA